MGELQWLPAWVADMTLPQLVCLANERPPGKQKVTSPEEFVLAMAEKRKAEAAWSERDWDFL